MERNKYRVTAFSREGFECEGAVFATCEVGAARGFLADNEKRLDVDDSSYFEVHPFEEPSIVEEFSFDEI